LDKKTIAEVGTYEQLLSAGLDVAKLLEKHTDTQSTDKDETKKDEKKDEDEKDDDGKLMTAEGGVEGEVDFEIYKGYVKSLGGPVIVFFTLSVFICASVSSMGSS